ncbi:MAG TPA: helix-turn-helix domain-containing protein [Planctomycetota bacterium]|nr:helix-turn-helix domain-containing protein [Planctomycetota bacterium]
MIRGRSLRALREAMGVTALELAAEAACPVETLLRAEFGLSLPREELRRRLATAYRLPVEEYVRLALDAADRAAG